MRQAKRRLKSPHSKDRNRPPAAAKDASFWSAAPQAPLYGRPPSDANVSGTLGRRTEPTTGGADNRRRRAELVRQAKAAPEVAALQRPQPPRQPPLLNGRNAF
jgi:hypothetical protein